VAQAHLRRACAGHAPVAGCGEVAFCATGGLHMLADATILTLQVALLGLSLVCWAAIYRKAGYSAWNGLLGLIPPLPLLQLAIAKWPIQRAADGTLSQYEADERVYALLEEGDRLEKRGRWEEALRLYSAARSLATSPGPQKDAEIQESALRARMGRESTAGGTATDA
jgi:hypothetical protein